MSLNGGLNGLELIGGFKLQLSINSFVDVPVELRGLCVRRAKIECSTLEEFGMLIVPPFCLRCRRSGRRGRKQRFYVPEWVMMCLVQLYGWQVSRDIFEIF